MALLQGTKKLFGPLLDDLDCVSAVKEATGHGVAGRGLQEGGKRGGSCYHHTGTFTFTCLADETFEMRMFMRGTKHHVAIFCEFFLNVN
jgi:hypothetical protein